MVCSRGRGGLILRPPLPSTCRTASEGNTTELGSGTSVPVLPAATRTPLRLVEEFDQCRGKHRGVNVMGLACKDKH